MRPSLTTTAFTLLACFALPLLAACHSLGPLPANVPKRDVAPDSREQDYRQAARLRGQALAAMDAADWERAIAVLQELESLLPDNVLAPLDLAVCHQQMNNPAAALAAAQRARKLAPENPRLLYALASIRHDAGDRDAREGVLDEYAAAHPHDPRPRYLRARWLEQEGESKAAYAAAEQAVEREPENLVLLVARLVTAGGAELFEETEAALDAVEDRLGGFDAPLAELATELRREIDGAREGSNETGKLPPLTQVIRNVLRPEGLYRQHLIPLVGSGSAGNGIFVQLDFDPALPKSIQGGQDIEISFADRTVASGLDSAGLRAEGSPTGDSSPPVWESLQLDAGDAWDTVLATTAAGTYRLQWSGGRWQSSRETRPRATERVWSRLDLDQDGQSDLLTDDGVRISLESSAASATLLVAHLDAPLSGVYPVDVDHDGDLDLVVSDDDGSRYLRNQGDGSWGEDPELLGELSDLPISDLASADLDDDGDLDLVVAAGGGVRVLINERHGQLEDGTLDWGLGEIAAPGARLAVEDFDADGLFDLLVWSPREILLLRNSGDRFSATPFPAAQPPAAGGWTAAAVADFDNDGDRDVLAMASAGVTLYRNQRDAFLAEPMTPLRAAPRGSGAGQLLAGDYDGDGDLDVLVRAGGSLAYWRNDGGSLNHWLRIRLRGKNENNSKNNSQGLFVRLESRAGDSYQAILGNGGVNHLGLGAYRQADVLRVIWTNGLSQTWAALAADQTLDEEQVLKGSCPFLYTWNGERFEFVTDLMWKSPLGMVLANGSAAPHQSARDFVLVPGERLRPAGGELWLQVTEELWETVYVDRQQLLAVDYPSGVDLIVDEKFTPPPHPDAPMLHWVGRRLAPQAARGHEGRDVLPLIQTRDGRHVDGLPLGRYQGTTETHHLELDFEDVPADGRTRLVLWGWIFPTDTSINVALSQNRAPAPSPPRLDLRTPRGWRTLVPSISFPSGKRKAMVVDLGETLPAGDITLRLTTDMQIYWDAALLALGEPEVAPVITPLEPVSADLHFRGFSRLLRDADSAPHLFDYATVSTTPRFRDLSGRYTRFGPVRDLLTAADDLYVVMNAGDEITVRYLTADLPELPTGWRRDYILHTDGWVKDGDINTAMSQSVEPLPHHGMASYPDPQTGFPDGPAQRRWREEYQTREVDDLPFKRQVVNEGTP